MITIVTGPPCAGKSTYVREHLGPADMVVDFDALAVTLGSPVAHGHPVGYLRTARVMWRAAVDDILATRSRAWIIHANPTTRELRRYRECRARVICVDPGETVVRRRAAAEQRPADTLAYIDQWYRDRR